MDGIIQTEIWVVYEQGRGLVSFILYIDIGT